MKNLFLSIAILMSVNVYSQSFGGKYGVILTKINNDLYTGPQQSWIFGGFYNHKLTDKISIQPELLLSDRGGYYREASRSVSQKYVDFPLQAKFSLPKNDIKPYFMAGVSPSILLSNKESKDGSVYASPVNAAGILTIGMDCKMTEKVEAVFELRGWAGLDYQSVSFNFGFKF